MTLDPRQVADAELRDAGASWRAHLASCDVCRRAEQVHGLYCDRGRRLYRDHRAAKRLHRRLTSS